METLVYGDAPTVQNFKRTPGKQKKAPREKEVRKPGGPTAMRRCISCCKAYSVPKATAKQRIISVILKIVKRVRKVKVFLKDFVKKQSNSKKKRVFYGVI